MKRFLWGCLLAVVGSLSCATASAMDPLDQPALRGPQAQSAVLQGIARAGQRLVAVGERGVILLSDDNGSHWRQAASVPVSIGLTALQFVDARNGWAVGHGGAVLRSEDAGEHWSLMLDGNRAATLELKAAQQDADTTAIAAARQLVADGADKPWLALSFTDANHGLVLGAYGLAMATEDGGRTWRSWRGRLANPQGLHLYAVARQGQVLYIAGEQGLLLRSQDGGEHFEPLAGPYEGSYFAAAVLPDGRLLLAGLRGKLFESRDRGDSFRALDSPLSASLNAIDISQGELLLASQAGVLLRSPLDGFAPRIQAVSEGLPLTASIRAADGALVTVGMAGPRRLDASSTIATAD